MVPQQQQSQLNYAELFRGGAVSADFLLHASSYLNTVVIPPKNEVKPLVYSPIKGLEEIEIETEQFGKINLEHFINPQEYRARGFLVVHKGKIVYENYADINADDLHLWMSCAKPTAGLLVDILISEGEIDEEKPITYYLKDFRKTDWRHVSVRDTMNMCSGLDVEDTLRSRLDFNKIPTRLYHAAFNLKHPESTDVERIKVILKSAKLKGTSGEVFEYASALTLMLVLLAEEVKGQPWPELFERLVWSKVKAEGELHLHLSPDGVAAPFGLISSNLRDLARFGMLYTPGWTTVSTERVVTDDILSRIQQGSCSAYVEKKSIDGNRFKNYLGTNDFIGNSRQWDVLWPDGDFWKSGLMSQGLYVSPAKDLVIAYFGVNNRHHTAHRFVRPIANSSLLNTRYD